MSSNVIIPRWLFAPLVILCVLTNANPDEASAESFDGRSAIIIDGDTIAVGPERIRLLDVDAPESFRAQCESELVAGLKAKERLAELLRAGSVWIDMLETRHKITCESLELRVNSLRALLCS